MIEELNEFLVRHGYSEEMAGEVASDYCVGEIAYLRRLYNMATVKAVVSWQVEVGEVEKNHFMKVFQN